jgi:hypothetical protein
MDDELDNVLEDYLLVAWTFFFSVGALVVGSEKVGSKDGFKVGSSDGSSVGE